MRMRRRRREFAISERAIEDGITSERGKRDQLQSYNYCLSAYDEDGSEYVVVSSDHAILLSHHEGYNKNTERTVR